MKQILTFIGVFSIALAVSNSSKAEPRVAQSTSGPKISIDPAAKIILERAAKTYGSKAKWRGQIMFFPSEYSFASEEKLNLSFERPKHLRLEKEGDGEYLLIVNNGRRESTFFRADGFSGESSHTPKAVPVEETLLGNAIAIASADGAGIGSTLTHFLFGKTGLKGPEFQEKTKDATAVVVKRLPDSSWKGQKCQRVVWDIRNKALGLFDVAHHRNELWFTPEGKLIKAVGFQEKKDSDGEKSAEWNDEITQQNFAPTFGPQTFIFAPPKSKKN